MRRPAMLAVIAVALIVAVLASWPRDPWQRDRVDREAIEAVRERARDDGMRFVANAPPTLHKAGREDMRALCGWVSSPSAAEPRFFFVLFEAQMFGRAIKDVFVQGSDGRNSGTGVEAFCQRPVVAT